MNRRLRHTARELVSGRRGRTTLPSWCLAQRRPGPTRRSRRGPLAPGRGPRSAQRSRPRPPDEPPCYICYTHAAHRCASPIPASASPSERARSHSVSRGLARLRIPLGSPQHTVITLLLSMAVWLCHAVAMADPMVSATYRSACHSTRWGRSACAAPPAAPPSSTAGLKLNGARWVRPPRCFLVGRAQSISVGPDGTDGSVPTLEDLCGYTRTTTPCYPVGDADHRRDPLAR